MVRGHHRPPGPPGTGLSVPAAKQQGASRQHSHGVGAERRELAHTLDPVGQELLPRPLADGVIGGKVRPGRQRPGGLAWNAHGDQRPTVARVLSEGSG